MEIEEFDRERPPSPVCDLAVFWLAKSEEEVFPWDCVKSTLVKFQIPWCAFGEVLQAEFVHQAMVHGVTLMGQHPNESQVEALLILAKLRQQERRTILRLQAMDQGIHEFMHDLMSPMTSLHFFLEIKPDLHPTVKVNLERMMHVISSFKTYAGLLKGKTPTGVHCIPTGFRESLSARFLPTLNSPPPVELIVEEDPGRYGILIAVENFYRILDNLVENAIYAVRENAGPGKVLVKTKYEAHGVYLLEVMDNGRGIPVENAHRIFDSRFTTKGHRGSGLGLHIVRELVESHGGHITVGSSYPDFATGARFTVRLPASHHP